MSEEHGWIIGKDISAREFGDAFCKAVDMAIEEFKKENPKQTIESLQAEIRKKDQELDALRKSWFDENQARELAEAEMRSEAKARMECEKYIGRLETAFVESKAVSISADEMGDDQCLCDRHRQKAKEALEKVNSSHALKGGASCFSFLIVDHCPLAPRPFCRNFRYVLHSVRLTRRSAAQSQAISSQEGHRIGE